MFGDSKFIGSVSSFRLRVSELNRDSVPKYEMAESNVLRMLITIGVLHCAGMTVCRNLKPETRNSDFVYPFAFMRVVDLIRKKRDGGELSESEIRFLVDGYTRDQIPDYQVSAWLMAALLRGLSAAELAALTSAMLHSGSVLDLSELPQKKVDKHSTGGVGDKTSLILAPLVAAGGLIVPMISGRGLGHTGGTLDKLEAIPSFNVNLSLDEFRRVLKQCGCAM